MRYRLTVTYPKKQWVHGELPKWELMTLIEQYLHKDLPITFVVSEATGKQATEKYFGRP